MSFALIGFGVSFVCVCILVLLFRHERITERRLLWRFREYADVVVLKILHRFYDVFRYVSRDFVKQVGHYSFHTILRGVLSGTMRAEKGIRNMMRVNKSLAKRAERESSTRSKLEELALHKAEVALTEREKKVMKDRSLRGM